MLIVGHVAHRSVICIINYMLINGHVQCDCIYSRAYINIILCFTKCSLLAPLTFWLEHMADKIKYACIHNFLPFNF